MNLDVLGEAVREPSLLAVLLTFAAGFLVVLSPAALPAISAVTGAVTSQEISKQKAFALSLSFVLGLVTINAVIGAGFGWAGWATMRFLGTNLVRAQLILGTLLVFLALVMWRKISIPFVRPDVQLGRIRTPKEAYLLGLPFGLLSCPSCTPLLLPIAAGVAATESPTYGAALMTTFALGQGIPLILLGAGLTRVAQSAAFKRSIRKIETLSGYLFLAGGVYLLWTATRALLL